MTLFGIDIAQITTDALQGNLKSATLTRVIPGEYNPVTDTHTDDEEVQFTSEGIIPAWSSTAGKAEMLEAGLITSSEIPILLLAQPLGTDPTPGDKIEINGATYTVTGIIEKDPAGATWTIKGEL